jgi:hypothetical protein
VAAVAAGVASATLEALEKDALTADVASAVTACTYLKCGNAQQYMYLPQEEMEGLHPEPLLGHAVQIEDKVAYGMVRAYPTHPGSTTAMLNCWACVRMCVCVCVCVCVSGPVAAPVSTRDMWVATRASRAPSAPSASSTASAAAPAVATSSASSASSTASTSSAVAPSAFSVAAAVAAAVVVREVEALVAARNAEFIRQNNWR